LLLFCSFYLLFAAAINFFAVLANKKNFQFVFGHGSSWASIDKPLTKGKGILYDDQTDNHVTTVEMRKVFETAGPVDILFMDSCLMQDMGVLYEIRKHTGIIIGSEMSIQANGVLYQYSLQEILEKPEMSTDDAADSMVFPGSFDMGHAVFTLSAVRSSALLELAARLNDIAASAMDCGELAAVSPTSAIGLICQLFLFRPATLP